MDFNHRARAYAGYRPHAHSARGTGQPGGRRGRRGACAGGGGGGGRVRFIYQTGRPGVRFTYQAGWPGVRFTYQAGRPGRPRRHTHRAAGPGVGGAAGRRRAGGWPPGADACGRPPAGRLVDSARPASVRHVLHHGWRLHAGLGPAGEPDLLPRVDLRWSAGGARRHDARRDGQPPLLLVVAHGLGGGRDLDHCVRTLRLGPDRPHRRPAPRRQVGRFRPAHDDQDEARLRQHRAVCVGRARLDAESDGRRSPDGCAFLDFLTGLPHKPSRSSLGCQASRDAPSRTRP